MRPVAITAALLFLLAALPTSIAVDDCAPGACVRITTANVPQDVPREKDVTYYLYARGATCAPTFASECSGRPIEGGVLGLTGILYEESNNYPGLQRFATKVGTTPIPPDDVVLL